MPQIMHMDKFVHACNLWGYRVIHIPYEPCPEGSSGCPQCKAGRVGFHKREPLKGAVKDVLRHARADGMPEILSHRFRVSPIQIVAPVGGIKTELIEGEDFVVEGRQVVWKGRKPDYQKEYEVSYEAVLESWVHMQHAYERKLEADQFQKMGDIPKGAIMMSINHENPGYHLMQGDVFIPVDGSVRVGRHIVAGRNNNRSMHRYVHEVERAYAVDTETGEEYPVDVGLNEKSLNFEINDDIEEGTKVAVIYRAAPQYSVYLDGGEFRNPLGQAHQRLVILEKLEKSI